MTINIECNSLPDYAETLEMEKAIVDAIDSDGTLHILTHKMVIAPDGRDTFVRYLHEHYARVVSDGDQIYATAPYGRTDGPAFVSAELSRNAAIKITVSGSYSFIDDTKRDIENACRACGPYLSWVYDRYMSPVAIPLDTSRLPIDQMYPFIGRPLVDYYHDFYASSSNVMICIGEPGTGKTTFIRGMLAALNVSASLTYQQEIFNSDEFFVNFGTSDTNIMVVEDADILLTPRQDGNSAMQRFLNSGDGLVSIPSHKLIFTTNLPNTSNIDPALIRSGRCFDVLHFRKLNPPEIQSLCEAAGISDSPYFNKPRTLAEVMNHHEDTPWSKKSK